MTDVTVRDAEGNDVVVPLNADPAKGAKQDSMIAALGAVSDTAAAATGGGSIIAFLRKLRDVLPNGPGQKAAAGSLGVVLASDQGAVPTTPANIASGKTAVAGALASTTLTTAFLPIAGRPFYLELTGTGSAVVTVEYQCSDGTTYAPNVAGVDGAAAIVMDKVAYAGAPLRLELATAINGQAVKALPDTVTGTVNYAFVQ